MMLDDASEYVKAVANVPGLMKEAERKLHQVVSEFSKKIRIF